MGAMKVDTNAGLLQVTYYTDPLCCWSWAFEPAWQQFKAAYAGQLVYKYCMCGMLPSWERYHDDVNAITRPLQMGPVWLQAKHMSGRPFNDRIWFEDPPASSWPACVAVKAAALQSAAAGERFLELLREAVMLQGRNIAKRDVLLSLATQLVHERNDIFNADIFEMQLGDDAVIAAFREDMQEAHFRGVVRLPALLIRFQEQRDCVLLTGNRPYEALEAAVQALQAKAVS